ncbi:MULTISPECIES: transporter [unclassified Methylobacterium]|uniref:transporter n=1 Tax=unclassified Methylobacterium TaxID=2615210 RepID=UPI001FB8F7DF|nr:MULTISPECIES: transporter [unclassified Methylobacterium]MCJ2095808.1 transporter [Methylobacterium sp. J-072]MCJ2139558.1 transporter [Methylobacterium sp. E-066]
MMSIKSGLSLITAALGACMSFSAEAIEINPGDNEQFPVGSTIGLLYYQYGYGNESYARGTKTTSDAKLDTNVGIIRLLHVYEVAPGVTLDPQFLLPVGAISTGGVLAPLGSPGGVGDLILAAPFKFKLDTAFNDVFAITPYLVAPTGSYDPTRSLNFGANRWQGLLQAGYIKHFDPAWSLDLTGDVTFYSDNTRYNFGGLGRLSQDPQFELQAYLRYKIDPVLEVAGGLGGKIGGNQSFRQVSLRNSQGTMYGRLGVAYFPEPTFQIQAMIGRDLTVENGTKQATFVQLRLAKIFP